MAVETMVFTGIAVFVLLYAIVIYNNPVGLKHAVSGHGQCRRAAQASRELPAGRDVQAVHKTERETLER